MNRKSEEIKEKQISYVMASIENRVRHAYNQGYEQGLKDSKQETCEQIKWERDTAIKQLNELGYGLGEKIKPCEEITREEAIKMLYGMKADNLNLANLYTKNKYDALEMAIKALEQEPKTGHWIQEPNGWVRCSRCSGHYPQTSYGPIIGTNYCPDCGADMRGAE